MNGKTGNIDPRSVTIVLPSGTSFPFRFGDGLICVVGCENQSLGSGQKILCTIPERCKANDERVQCTIEMGRKVQQRNRNQPTQPDDTAWGDVTNSSTIPHFTVWPLLLFVFLSNFSLSQSRSIVCSLSFFSLCFLITEPTVRKRASFSAHRGKGARSSGSQLLRANDSERQRQWGHRSEGPWCDGVPEMKEDWQDVV